MSENYQVGELIRADVVIRGKVERVLLTYISDYLGDEVPWRRLVSNPALGGGWHTTDDLANIERMVAVPVVTRAQVFDILYPDGIMPHEDMHDSKIDALLTLFEQGKA